jgi:hypothetical protein
MIVSEDIRKRIMTELEKMSIDIKPNDSLGWVACIVGYITIDGQIYNWAIDNNFGDLPRPVLIWGHEDQPLKMKDEYMFSRVLSNDAKKSYKGIIKLKEQG